jgi:hypothetical protein
MANLRPPFISSDLPFAGNYLGKKRPERDDHGPYQRTPTEIPEPAGCRSQSPPKESEDVEMEITETMRRTSIKNPEPQMPKSWKTQKKRNPEEKLDRKKWNPGMLYKPLKEEAAKKEEDNAPSDLVHHGCTYPVHVYDPIADG